MRVAICLSGEMRPGPTDCAKLLWEQVAVPFQQAGAEVIDLFVHTRRDEWWLQGLNRLYDAGFKPRHFAVEENRVRSIKDILSPHNPLDRGENSGDERRSFLYQSYMQQFWSLEAVGDMVVRAVDQDGLSYDWVVRARPDCHLVKRVDVSKLVPGKINFPWNDWWHHEVEELGIETVTDKFAVGPQSPMLCGYFSVVADLGKFCEQYRLMGEGYLAWRLHQGRFAYTRLDSLEVSQIKDPYVNSWRPDRDGN